MNACVLLVDSESEVRERLETSFRTAGFAFASVRSAERAIEAAEYLKPSVVILDVVLDDADGFDVFRRLRERPDLHDVPFLFLTGVDDDRFALAAYEIGAADYVTKPVNPDVLVAKVRRMLEREAPRGLSSPFEVKPGMVFGDRYRIVRELGRGNMGVVFLTEHQTLNVSVALKAMVTHGRDLKVVGKRFEREAQALARMDHPNLIRVHDAGWWGYVPYMVMDYVAGGTVADRLGSIGRFQTARALEIATRVASGVHHAHEHGVLHRDLKAANILLDGNGTPIVTDFGLLLEVQRIQDRLTEQGLVTGTPHYMSPEQIRTPDAVDARSDVYAIGVLLFEMLVGRPPFGGVGPMEAMTQIMREEPPSLLDCDPEIPAIVDLCCRNALRLDPDKRYQTARELEVAIRVALKSLKEPGPQA